MAMKVPFFVAIHLFSLWAVTCVPAGKQTEKEPCLPSVLDNSGLVNQSEWMSLLPRKDAATNLSFPGMKFTCAGNITGLALGIKQPPNLNWRLDLSLTLYVDGNVKETIAQSTSEGSLPSIVTVTLKNTVSVQKGSELQFQFPEPAGELYRHLPVAFVRSEDLVTTIIPTAADDSTNCSIFGRSVEGNKDCRVQPLLQVYSVPVVSPSKTASVKPLSSPSPPAVLQRPSSSAVLPSSIASIQPSKNTDGSKSSALVKTTSTTTPPTSSVVERRSSTVKVPQHSSATILPSSTISFQPKSKNIESSKSSAIKTTPTKLSPKTDVKESSKEPQHSSATILPSPAASSQPSETVEASGSHSIETMSAMPSASTRVVTGGGNGAPTGPLPFHYLLLIPCLCVAVFLILLVSTVCLVLCCTKRRRSLRKNRRVNVEPSDIYDAPHIRNGCDKPVPLAQYENVGNPPGDSPSKTSRMTVLSTSSVTPLCPKSCSNRSGSFDYMYTNQPAFAAEMSRPSIATYELPETSSLDEVEFDVDHDYEDPGRVMMNGWKDEVVFHAKTQDTVTNMFVVPTTVERNRMFAQPHDWQTEGIYAVYRSVTSTKVPHQAQMSADNVTYKKPPDAEQQIYQTMSALQFMELPRPTVTVLEHLGTGHYGSVHKGEWAMEEGTQVVAVKILRRGALKVKLLQEAMTMGQFSHPNVLKLLGVVTLVEPIMMVMEMAANGDLKLNLLTARERIVEVDVMSASCKLFKFTTQVAEGMRYLEGQHFVHQHLNARNILLDDCHNCKITGFVASEQVEGSLSTQNESRIRWTSPEAHLCGKYTSSSDVWSYGMLMYEIWSLGHKPFQAMPLTQVLNIINTGYCQPPPPGCPAKVYALMVKCWNPEYRSRPSFGDVCCYLQEHKEAALEMCEEGSRSEDPSLKLGSPLEEGLRLYMDLQKTYT